MRNTPVESSFNSSTHFLVITQKLYVAESFQKVMNSFEKCHFIQKPLALKRLTKCTKQ